jgi:hypothetical protein
VAANSGKITLSEEQIRFYRDNGFLQVDDVLSGEELGQLRACMLEAMTAELGEAGRTSHNKGCSSSV